MTIPATPDEAQCLALLEKYATPSHIIDHSRRVWDVGRLIGIRLIEKNLPLNLDLIRASCLLHDIGKYPCLVDGQGYHDVRGKQILVTEGLPQVARIVVQHVVLDGHPNDAVREEHVLYYSDKRVVHDRLASLDERFVYLAQTYGKTEAHLKRLEHMKQETVSLEHKIFQHLDFKPDEVRRLIKDYD